MISSDQDIADGLARGEPEAFRALYQAQGRAVLAYLTRLTGRREMAEELTQETFLTVIRKIGFFRAGPDGGLKAWVFRIATNLAFDALRRDRRVALPATPVIGTEGDAAVEPAGQQTGPHEAFERLEFGRRLEEALQRLTTAQRMVFLLREQEQLSLLEISRVCGCSENAIKQGLFRARATLRKILCE